MPHEPRDRGLAEAGAEDSRRRGQASHAQPRGSSPPMEHPSQGPGREGDSAHVGDRRDEAGGPMGPHLPQDRSCVGTRGWGGPAPRPGRAGLSALGQPWESKSRWGAPDRAWRVPGVQQSACPWSIILGSVDSGHWSIILGSVYSAPPKRPQVGQGRQEAQQ